MEKSREMLRVVDAAIEANPSILALKSDVAQLKDETRRLGILMESTDSKIDQVLEAVSPLLQKASIVDKHSELLEKHSIDHDITRNALKNHISNKSIHITPKVKNHT